MRRRAFIALLGSATAAWPLAALAQQPAIPVIGYLDTASASTTAHLIAAFRQGLAAAGYEEGRNVVLKKLPRQYQLSLPLVLIRSSLGSLRASTGREGT